MNGTPALYLCLLTALLCFAVNGQYVPTMLACGSSSDVKTVTNFPYSITSEKDTLTYTTTTWRNPLPEYNSTCNYSGAIVSYLVRHITTFREVNGSSKDAWVIKSFDMSNLTWEASATKIISCEGFYLKGTLDNGGIIEIHYYTYHDDHQFTYGDQTFINKKGQTKQSTFITNYPYTHPNISLPQFEVYARYPGSIGYLDEWEFAFGSFVVPGFTNDEPNTTHLATLTAPHNTAQIDQIIDSIVVGFTEIDYSLVNGSQKNVVFQRGAPEEVTGAGVLSLTLVETHVGTFSGTADTFLHTGKSWFSINIIGGSGDGDSGSAASLFGESIAAAVRFNF